MSGEHAPQRTRSPAGLDRNLDAQTPFQGDLVRGSGMGSDTDSGTGPGTGSGTGPGMNSTPTEIRLEAPGDDERVCGFITGFIRPRSAVTLFVWQVAVGQAHRGQGLAKRMLDYLGDRMTAEGRRYLEATVTPDNIPSRRLFEAFARDRGCAIERHTLFTQEQFPRGHQPEVLFRIGPL